MYVPVLAATWYSESQMYLPNGFVTWALIQYKYAILTV